MVLTSSNSRAHWSVAAVSVLLVLSIAQPLVAQENSTSEESANADEAAAQQDEAIDDDLDVVSSDRPGFTDSSVVLPKQTFQLEAGASFDVMDNQTSFDPLDVVARYGVVDIFELRLGVSALGVDGVGNASTGTDFSPVSSATLGGKVGAQLSDAVSLGALPYVSVNGVSNDLSVSGGVKALLDLTAGEPLSLTFNLGIENIEDINGDRGFETSGGLALNIGILDDLDAYWELYAIVPPAQDISLYTDAGVMYRLSNSVQLDAWVGVQIPDATSVIGGLGVSARL
jgi:hypothetical protein